MAPSSGFAKAELAPVPGVGVGVGLGVGVGVGDAVGVGVGGALSPEPQAVSSNKAAGLKTFPAIMLLVLLNE
jgi:hypothetical protein